MTIYFDGVDTKEIGRAIDRVEVYGIKKKLAGLLEVEPAIISLFTKTGAGLTEDQARKLLPCFQCISFQELVSRTDLVPNMQLIRAPKAALALKPLTDEQLGKLNLGRDDINRVLAGKARRSQPPAEWTGTGETADKTWQK